MKIQLITLSLLLTAFAVSAGDHSERLAKLDADLDGKISMEEAAVDPALNVLFKEVDTDGDGFISSDELIKVTEVNPKN